MCTLFDLEEHLLNAGICNIVSSVVFSRLFQHLLIVLRLLLQRQQQHGRRDEQRVGPLGQ